MTPPPLTNYELVEIRAFLVNVRGLMQVALHDADARLIETRRERDQLLTDYRRLKELIGRIEELLPSRTGGAA